MLPFNPSMWRETIAAAERSGRISLYLALASYHTLCAITSDINRIKKSLSCFYSRWKTPRSVKNSCLCLEFLAAFVFLHSWQHHKWERERQRCSAPSLPLCQCLLLSVYQQHCVQHHSTDQRRSLSVVADFSLAK